MCTLFSDIKAKHKLDIETTSDTLNPGNPGIYIKPDKTMGKHKLDMCQRQCQQKFSPKCHLGQD